MMHIIRGIRTYQAWAWFLLGGAALMPFMLGALVVRTAAGDTQIADPYTVMDIRVAILVLPVVALVGGIFPTREISIFFARVLLGCHIPLKTSSRDWRQRWRDSVWLTFHVGLGALISGITLALLPFAALIIVLAFNVPVQDLSTELLGASWQPWYGLPVGIGSLLALIYLVHVTGRLARVIAPKLLGPSTAELLALSQAKARSLAARNRIARELHDSVGHALSVVTVQAEAAARLIDNDPEFARVSLQTIAQTARSAVDDLDDALGVLRDDREALTPREDLSDIESMVANCGLKVDLSLDVDLRDVDPQVSREAYAIIREALTNVLRHGTGTASVAVSTDTAVRVTISNAVAGDGTVTSGRRGILGMRERAAMVGGSIEVQSSSGRFVVNAVFPLRSLS